MGGSLLSAASAGDCRNVKGPCPALRPGRLRGAFRFRELVPCFGPRPAAFNSLRSCSFSPRRRSISLSACFNCSRKPRFPASYSFSCLRRSSCLEPFIAPYRDTKPPKCPAFSANQLRRVPASPSEGGSDKPHTVACLLTNERHQLVAGLGADLRRFNNAGSQRANGSLYQTSHAQLPHRLQFGHRLRIGRHRLISLFIYYLKTC